ncbi:IclR family transcriptional regulator [Aeromicrobium sp. UC242_57]|uniref:IclR family transcriptional regulator n=1 Tax=Aeromicrobium sp. UC242_57 TaxID=3374624 RepID=UPI0037A3FA21
MSTTDGTETDASATRTRSSDKDPRDRQIVAALAKGLEVLRCFERPGEELTVSEIARRVGLTQPTAWRLSHTLVEHGYLVRSVDGAALHVGMPAVMLGYAAVRGLSLLSLAQPGMRDVTRRTSLTTTLAMCHSEEMLSIQQVDGEVVVTEFQSGWRTSLTSTTSGLAVLARMNEADRKESMQRLRDRDLDAWPRREERILSGIAQLERDGFVRRDDIAGGRYAAVGVAIVEHQHHVNGMSRRYWGLSCGGPQALLHRTQLELAGEELILLQNFLQSALDIRAGLTP